MKVESKTLSELEEMQNSGPICGVFKVIDDDYHSFKAINSTSIKAASISMAHFNSKYDPDPTAPISERASHFAFGSALHAYMLDMPEFNRSFVVRPNLDLRTKEGRAWKEENKYRYILSRDDFYYIQKMSKSIVESFWWQEFTEGEHYTELAMFWVCDTSGLQCKSKVDLFNPKIGILDLKTTSKNVTERELFYAYKNYRYDLQQAHYVAGLRSCVPYSSERFALGFVEKNAPFATRSTILEATTQTNTEAEYKSLMLEIAHALETGCYPGPAKKDETYLEIKL